MSGETVWLLPRTEGVADAHGRPTATWPAGPDSVGAVRIDRAKVAPRVVLANEPDLPLQDQVIDGLHVYLPAGPRPGPHDRMWVRGNVYDLIGEPGVWVAPRGTREVGVQVMVRRVEG